MTNMFLHFVIQRPNGHRLISSPNPDELGSKIPCIGVLCDIFLTGSVIGLI